MIGQYPTGVVPERTPVKQMYHDLISQGMDPKSAAKTAQEKTGMSVVTGKQIVKKLEFSATGKAGYGGNYPSRESGPKRWKPAAWPSK